LGNLWNTETTKPGSLNRPGDPVRAILFWRRLQYEP